MTIRGGRRAHVIPITAPSFPTLPRPRVYRNIAYTFIALTVIIVVGVLWLSSVRAVVHVKAKRLPVRLEGAVGVAKTPASGQIAGRVVQGVFEKIQEFTVPEVTSTVVAPAPTAPVSAPVVDQNVVIKGQVKFTNTLSSPMSLVVKTRLITPDNLVFHIDKGVNIPAHGQVSVGVYADQPGLAYAIQPTKFTVLKLAANLQKMVYAQSDKAFTSPSGATLSVTAPAAPKIGKYVTSALLAEAEKTLTDVVLDQAKKALAAEVSDPKFTDVVYLVKLVSSHNNVSPGQAADSYMASVKLDVTAIYYPHEDMLTLLRQRLKEKVPEGRELMPLEANAVTYNVQTADAKVETATIGITADGNYRLTSLSTALQKDAVAGRAKSEAITLLRAVDGVDDVTIDMSPSWFTKIPSLKDHIDIVVE